MSGKRYRSSLAILVAIAMFLASVILFAPTNALAAVEPDFIYYRIQAGDSLWLISWRFDTTIGEVKNLNGLQSDGIIPGQVLKLNIPKVPVRQLPESAAYTVKRGDSLYLTGQRFGVSVTNLMTSNGLKDNVIYAGQVLNIPIPAQQYYYVKGGDTLYVLAGKFGTTVDMLTIVNRMTSPALWVGQILFVPGSGAEQPDSSGQQPDSSGQEPDQGGTPPGQGDTPEDIPPGGKWGDLPSGVVLYHVKSGENLWTLAKKFNTTQTAITETNHLHTDLLMVDQPLFIPQDSSLPVTIPYPYAARKPGYGELLDWKYVSWVLDTRNTAVITDLDTGKSFTAHRLGGSNHSDMEPLTIADTQIMKAVFGGEWSWNRRAVLVKVGDKVIAGSMAGMPHDIQTITDNNFPGHFDLHFLNSKTHNTNTIDSEHQKMVQKAAGN